MQFACTHHARTHTRTHMHTPIHQIRARPGGRACARTHTQHKRVFAHTHSARTHIHTHSLICLRFHLNIPEHAIDNHASLAVHRPVQGTQTIMSSSFPCGNTLLGQAFTSKAHTVCVNSPRGRGIRPTYERRRRRHMLIEFPKHQWPNFHV